MEGKKQITQRRWSPQVSNVAVGHWHGKRSQLVHGPVNADQLAASLRQVAMLVYDTEHNSVALATQGRVSTTSADDSLPLLGLLPPSYPEWLGKRGFCEAHGLRFAYMGGSMARGIASTELVVALAELGALGMFGTAGLPVKSVDTAITRLQETLDTRGLAWGCNLIHSPDEPALEDSLVDLYLRRAVCRVEASAFMSLTPAIVRYSCTGLHRDSGGMIRRRNQLFAKVSREEVAKHFLSPPPERLLTALVERGQLTAEEATLAREIPLAQQVIVESDSGGHTDNRPLGALFPAIQRLRDDLQARYQYREPLYLGAAGGMGTPEALAAAYAMGAAFVVLGSVHQAACESGVGDDSKALLAQAGPADIAMTASADMFELGVKVQVLTRGTMMAVRGNQLLALYRQHARLEDIPAATRESLEKNLFRQPLESVWEQTRAYFKRQDPRQLEKAENDPKHRMALVFRWYLGNSSRWPLAGDKSRQADYQLWCGPAMGAFNRWAAGSFLEAPEARSVQQIALNLLEGAALTLRAQQYRGFGLALTSSATRYRPVPLRIADTQDADHGQQAY